MPNKERTETGEGKSSLKDSLGTKSETKKRGGRRVVSERPQSGRQTRAGALEITDDDLAGMSPEDAAYYRALRDKPVRPGRLAIGRNDPRATGKDQLAVARFPMRSGASNGKNGVD